MKPITCSTLGGLGIMLVISFLVISGSAPKGNPSRPTTAQSTSMPVVGLFPNSASTPYTASAIFQTFEHGFMVWRADYNCVYALVPDTNTASTFRISRAIIGNNYEYCLLVAPLTEKVAASTPPAGLLVPTGVLGKVWRAYSTIQQQLGFAIQPEQAYRATIPSNQGAASLDGLPFTMAQMTLPDGSVLACGSRAATAGTCNY